LKNLGLSEKEARVYVALLEIGQSTAYSVANKSGLKKPTTYVVLDELRKKGLVLKLPHARKHLYSAKPPHEVLSAAEEKLYVIKQILPQLAALSLKGAVEVKTLFYEGFEGIREALWYKIDNLSNEECVAFSASGVDASKKLIQLFRELNDAFKERNVRNRSIARDHPSLQEFRSVDAEYNRKVKVIPNNKYSSNISVEIHTSFIRILMFKELQCVIIDNPNVAMTFKQIFEMVWAGIPDLEA
jgi:sugar-specific transcriptional regulator TrmB